MRGRRARAPTAAQRPRAPPPPGAGTAAGGPILLGSACMDGATAAKDS